MIIHETIKLLRMRLGYEQALQFGIRLLGETTTPIIRMTQADEEKAWAIFRQYPDKRVSFTDCTSFAIMKRLGIGTAFAFDDDFRQFGKCERERFQALLSFSIRTSFIAGRPVSAARWTGCEPRSRRGVMLIRIRTCDKWSRRHNPLKQQRLWRIVREQ
ncbi:MAG: PIN domain-containing protein [Nitrospira sp.]|nr:PIN domain-containing protein [Nitrospira sp.]MBH0184369.1 PIN domain-containing protein [Nitrospira sp.]